MSVTLNPADFTINSALTMRYMDMPIALDAHLGKCPSTVRVEDQAGVFVATAFPVSGAEAFVDSVCRWGGKIGPFIASFVIRKNTPSTIASQLAAAHASVNPGRALAAVMKLHHLSISFGSKHLRMMSPRTYVVLDRVLSSRLKYPLSLTGYDHICRDCLEIAKKLTALHIPNPMDHAFKKIGKSNPRACNTEWWPADVELAIFAESQNWSNTGSWKPTIEQAKPKEHITKGEPPYTVFDFESFWSWLQEEQTAPTLVRPSHVKGRSDDCRLKITTSNGKPIKPIRKATVKRYCEDAWKLRFQDLEANKRWVAALLLRHLSDER